MIESGTLLIEKYAPRPECLQLAPGPDSTTWASVTRDLSARDLDKELAAGGWSFSYRAGALRATGFGFNPADRIAAAVKHLIAAATHQQCNCLEIDEVASHTFLGFPYSTVSAHARHIQKDTASSGR